ncbi:MAG: TonB-dependent receptor [Myxococcales bacterium]|nr:TonB-dependent receptor [Myxococcales bacterium]
MSRPRRRAATRGPVSSALALALATSMLPAAAMADGLADEAELHFQIARRRFQAGDFEGALEHFFTSNRLVRNRNVLFNIGGTFEQMGRLPEAHRYYYTALEGETNPRVIADVRAALERIAPRVAVLDVTTDPPNAALFLDRRDLGERGRSGRPLALEPGTYRVIAELEGYEPAQSEPLTVAVGRRTEVVLRLRRIIGTIAVNSAQGATVRIDDEQRGPTCTAPCTLEVTPGPHTIFVSREGFAPETRTVVVSARQQTSATVTLRPLVGTLVIEADERDALVEVDGRTAGFAPLVLRDVPVGRRRVRVSLSGFRSVEREIEVRATGEARLTDVSLAPVREVIAASRRVEQLEDAPASVSVISAREIEAFQYTTIAEALQGTRGVYVSNDRAYHSIGIRGLGQPNDYGNRLLIQQDGAVLNDNLLYSSYVGHDGRSSLDLVDRIEVVRGPGSLLYGTGAISGVINLALRGRDVRTGASAGISAYGENMGRVRASGTVRIGPEAGAMLALAVGASQGVDATLQVPSMMGAPTEQVVQGAERLLTASMSGRAWWRDLSAQWHVSFQEHDIPVGAYATTVGDSATRWTDGRVMAEVKYEPRLGRTLQLFTRAHVNMYRFLGNYAYDGGPLSREAYLGLWAGGEARAEWTPLSALKLTAGGEFQGHAIATLTGEGLDRTMPSVAPTRYLDVSRPYTVGSGYALIDLSPARWFRFTGGARVDAFSLVAPGVSFRGALLFRPGPRTNIKLMGGRAFRAPSIYEQSYTDGLTQRASCPLMATCNLRPEVVYTGELEWNQRISDDWSFTVAANTSYLVDILDTAGEGTMANQLRYENGQNPVLSIGGDAELRREFRQGWFFTASYNVQHTRFLGGTIARPGLTNAPDHQGALKMVAPLLPPYASAAVRATFVGPRRVRQDTDEWTTPAILGDVVVSGQVTRLGLRYSFGVYNVLDWRWNVPVTETFVVRTMPQPGRTFAVHLQASF